MFKHLAANHEIVFAEFAFVRGGKVKTWRLVVERVQISESIFEIAGIYLRVTDSEATEAL